MEIVFIRHGEGEHTSKIPDSLHIADPYLTDKGKIQAKALKHTFPLSLEDIVIVSPTRRTLETAKIWTGEISCKKIVHPFVAPRLFPIKAGASTLPCDIILKTQIINKDFPTFGISEIIDEAIWTDGINTLPEDEFRKLANNFIDWCRLLNREKVYIVSHDGTVTAYRQIISGKKLSRADFPEETGVFTLDV